MMLQMKDEFRVLIRDYSQGQFRKELTESFNQRIDACERKFNEQEQ